MDKRPPGTAPKPPSLVTRLETSRLYLRPPRASDVPSFRAHLRRSAEHLRPWSPAASRSEDPVSLTSLSKLILKQRSDWKQGTSFTLLVIARAPRETLVGRVSFANVVRGVFQNAHLGYEIDVDEIGRGYATEAVGAALSFAFETLGLHRIQAAIMPSNIRSLRVVAKLGFRQEGCAARYLCIADQWEDHLLFAQTYEDVSGGVVGWAGATS